jgi:hypothetical protein
MNDEVYFLRRSIVEVTDLREGGDVRGSPLAVIIALDRSRVKHIPCLDDQGGLVAYPVAGVDASHEKFEGGSRSKPSTLESFFDSWILSGTCAWESARQMSVISKYVGSEPPSRNGLDNGKAHPSVAKVASPKEEVPEGLMTLAKAKSEHLVLVCMRLDRNV